MAMMRVYFQRQLRLDRLNFSQRQMYEIANDALADVKRRVKAAQNVSDGAAKPLKKGYAIYKSKLGKGNRRDLTLSGKMLDNLTVRSVSETKARAENTTRRDREKARGNEQIQPWLQFSPKNQAVAVAAAIREFNLNAVGIVRVIP